MTRRLGKPLKFELDRFADIQQGIQFGIEQAVVGPFVLTQAGNQQSFHHWQFAHNDEQPATAGQLLAPAFRYERQGAGDGDSVITLFASA